MYYVNTWNQEIRWVKPLEISLFEESSGGGATNRPGTANSSKDSDADEELGGDTVSSRFRQRLVELTGEATRAAEEEERFLRHVVANIATISASYNIVKSKGGDEGAESAADQTLLALGAAREWRFVSTDSRFSLPSTGTTKNKCWYRAKTSEYFWGGNPPLLGLLPCLPETTGSHERNPGSSAGRSGSGGSVGTNSTLGNEGVDAAEGGAGPPDGVAVVHPELGLMFVDRAAGETWLKTQDLGSLLNRSEKVCDIGRAGWCQLKAAIPSEAAFAAVTEDGVVRGGGNISKGSGTVKAPLGDSPRAATSAAAAAEMDDAATAGVAVLDTSRSGGSSKPGPLFTFFHHPQMGEARWCLSPRSALLATPRTPRREAFQARLASARAQGWDSESTSGGAGNVEQSFAGTDLGASALTSGASKDDSGDGWEIVEDGEMVFYYNKRLGVSTWEPPPGWAQGGSQEIYGTGG